MLDKSLGFLDQVHIRIHSKKYYLLNIYENQYMSERSVSLAKRCGGGQKLYRKMTAFQGYYDCSKRKDDKLKELRFCIIDMQATNQKATNQIISSSILPPLGVNTSLPSQALAHHPRVLVTTEVQ